MCMVTMSSGIRKNLSKLPISCIHSRLLKMGMLGKTKPGQRRKKNTPSRALRMRAKEFDRLMSTQIAQYAQRGVRVYRYGMAESDQWHRIGGVMRLSRD